ncbi:E3 ubiquitin-protein ligase MARCHF7 isoform X3 [Festucalex cinctus]
MDSTYLRLPLCLSTSRSSYMSTPRASLSSSYSSSSSSTSMGPSRLYSRESLPHRDCFPRASSTYKADVGQKSSRLLRSSSDYSSSDRHSSCSSSWNPLTSSTRSYERPWTESSSVSSRTKLTVPEGMFSHSSLSTSTDYGDNKRPQLICSNIGRYSSFRTSFTGSNYTSSGLNNARAESSRCSSCLMPRSSTSCSRPLLSSREVETPKEPDQTARLASTYAQGARPKDYSSCTLTAARESAPGGHVASTSFTHRLSTARNSPSTLLLKASSQRASVQEQPTSCRPKVPLTRRPTPKSDDPHECTSRRQRLSRLFSTQSSQDSPSSSRSSSVRSFGDSLSLDTDEGDTMSSGTEQTPRSWSPNAPGTRQHRLDLSRIWENKDRGVAGSRLPLPREPEEGTREAASGGDSWLSSSLRSRCPPLDSSLRRHTRDESGHSSAGLSCPQHLLRKWDDLELSAAQNDEEDDDDDEEEQGALGLHRYGAPCPRRQEEDEVPQMVEALAGLAQRRWEAPLQNGASLPQGGDERTLDSAGIKQEKLRMIKERLLLEDSDDDEGDRCRICQMGQESASNPLIQPCRCTGSLQYVHQDCIKRWLSSKIGSGTNLEAITNCELCKAKLRLNIDDFDVQQLYRAHTQSEFDSLVSSGLYMVVLLQFYEQRLSDVRGVLHAVGECVGFETSRLLRFYPEDFDNLESTESQEETDYEEQDCRPSVDFSDLDEEY